MEKSATILLLLKRVDCNDGVAAYCETLISGLRERGDRVVIASGPVSFSEATRGRKTVLETLADEWLVVPGLGSPTVLWHGLRTVLRLIRRLGVDVISPQGFTMLPLARLLSLISGAPVVANYHPSIQGNDARSIATAVSLKERAFYRLVTALARPQKFIALSKDIEAFLGRTCGLKVTRIASITAGVDTIQYQRPTSSERTAARAKFDIPSRAMVCVLTGRMSLNKGHDLVVDAVRDLSQTHPNLEIVCLFPGGGEQEREIKARTILDDHDAKSFRFLGYVSNEELRQAYWASDIALLPSRREGFGLVIAEAMACGCVPIRTPSGGAVDQIIDGETGFIVPFNDAALLRAVSSILPIPGAVQP